MKGSLKDKTRRLQNTRKAPYVFTTIFLILITGYGSIEADGDIVSIEQWVDQHCLTGGLVVLVGDTCASLAVQFAQRETFLVQGLVKTDLICQNLHRELHKLGCYGRVTIDDWQGDRFPYAPNMVNMLVVEQPQRFARDELMRVLIPGGMAFVRENGKWKKIIKPWGDEIDQWTHYYYDATGNPVSKDIVVGPPKHLQWVGAPRWSRHHDHITSLNALVSANGRIFSIIDEGARASVLLPAKWMLVAQDAFNGVVLWKRPLSPWISQLWGLKAGPAQLPRRLVAIKDRVYITLGIGRPVSVLDAATGKLLKTLESTMGAEELIAGDGTLFAVTSDDAERWLDYRPDSTYVWRNAETASKHGEWTNDLKRVVAVDLKQGEPVWERHYPVVQLTLAADASAVYIYDGSAVVALNRASGAAQWRSDPLPSGLLLAYTGPRLIVHEGVIVFTGGETDKPVYCAISADDGSTLWSESLPRTGHYTPYDLSAAHGQVWSGNIVTKPQNGLIGRNLKSGAIQTKIDFKGEFTWFHQRCHPAKATIRFLIPGRCGIEFIDYRDGSVDFNHWVRGSCLYGTMPANGLIYAPPHACACFMEGKLNGFNALAPGDVPGEQKSATPEERLQRGPVYGSPLKTGAQRSNSGNWPTYRHDAARSGATKTKVSADLKLHWTSKLMGKLSSPVVSDGRVFVASIDAHTVHALDQKDGSLLWQFTAGSRVDSPPSVFRDRVIFGSADGWIYCVRAGDGQLIWRFRAAPVERRVVAYGQLESAWPVHGSVLIREEKSGSHGRGIVYGVAGRSSFLDGGMRLVRVNAESGELLSETVLDEIDPEIGKDLHYSLESLTMLTSLPDVLSCDGEFVYMRSRRFDLDGNNHHQPKIADKDIWRWMTRWRQQIDVDTLENPELTAAGQHLFSPVGFLDDSDFYRTYWVYGKRFTGGWWGWYKAGRIMPSGKLLVFNDTTVYGFGRNPAFLAQSAIQEYHLFAADKHTPLEAIRRTIGAEPKMRAAAPEERQPDAENWAVRERFPLGDQTAVKYDWRVKDLSFQVRALVLAGNVLFAAGPPDVVDERLAFRQLNDPNLQKQIQKQEDALAGLSGGVLRAVSAEDGTLIKEYYLTAPPVWDGMAAAQGQLYLSLLDGTVQCWTATK